MLDKSTFPLETSISNELASKFSIKTVPVVVLILTSFACLNLLLISPVLTSISTLLKLKSLLILISEVEASIIRLLKLFRLK